MLNHLDLKILRHVSKDRNASRKALLDPDDERTAIFQNVDKF
jgi:hypothetical protein